MLEYGVGVQKGAVATHADEQINFASMFGGKYIDLVLDRFE